MKRWTEYTKGDEIERLVWYECQTEIGPVEFSCGYRIWLEKRDWKVYENVFGAVFMLGFN